MASVDNNPTSDKPKILLVDDREDNLLSIEAVLEPDGYQFFRAYSGHQALRTLLNDFDFAMILMDVKMPVLNGFETAALIYEREKLRHVPIIFITANNYGDDNIFKGYKAGGIDYIFKPINPEVLRAKVTVFIDMYKKNVLLIEQEQKLSFANKALENEIIQLKVSEAKAKQFNTRLQNEISDLVSILVSSKSTDQIEFEQSDLNGLIKNLLEGMDDQLRGKMATVLVEPLPSLKANRVLMRSLFQQLIQHVLDSGKEKVILRIRSEAGALPDVPHSKNLGDNHYCHIIVENNGDRSLIDQNGNGKTYSSSDQFQNGLALCKKIMDAHNGFIDAQSKVDEGTRFIVSFPP